MTKFNQGDIVFYPIDYHYSDSEGIEHLEFNVAAYEWNVHTLNSLDSKFICKTENDCIELCKLLNKINGY
jgi:hypothetical protein